MFVLEYIMPPNSVGSQDYVRLNDAGLTVLRNGHEDKAVYESDGFRTIMISLRDFPAFTDSLFSGTECRRLIHHLVFRTEGEVFAEFDARPINFPDWESRADMTIGEIRQFRKDGWSWIMATINKPDFLNEVLKTFAKGARLLARVVRIDQGLTNADKEFVLHHNVPGARRHMSEAHLELKSLLIDQLRNMTNTTV